MSAGEWLPLRCRRSIPVNGCRWRCRRSIPVNGCRRWITVAAAGCGTLVADVCREGRRAESIAEIFSSILRLRADCPMLEAISSLIFVILPGIGRFRKNKRRNFVYFDCQVDFRQNRRSFFAYCGRVRAVGSVRSSPCGRVRVAGSVRFGPCSRVRAVGSVWPGPCGRVRAVGSGRRRLCRSRAGGRVWRGLFLSIMVGTGNHGAAGE